MKKFYTINIPEPCHENWDAMTPNEQGRHCESCAKTVIDFTQMELPEIHSYLAQQGDKQVCGRMMARNLEGIHVQIPVQIFKPKLSFHRSFLLALLIAMGSSLLSCQDDSGHYQAISNVEIIDESTYLIEGKASQGVDSVEKVTPIVPTNIGKVIVKGLMISPPYDPNAPRPFILLENPPQFKDTPQNLSLSEKKDYFQKRMNDYIQTNFQIETFKNLELQGRQRISVKFVISEEGIVSNVKVRAVHPMIEAHTREIIAALPHFIPGEDNDKATQVVYSLPIIFDADQL